MIGAITYICVNRNAFLPIIGSLVVREEWGQMWKPGRFSKKPRAIGIGGFPIDREAPGRSGRALAFPGPAFTVEP